MSADTGLARFDTRRAAQTDEHSQQTDLRIIGAREHGQLALDELDTENQATSKSQASADTPRTAKPTRADLEAALGCARAPILGVLLVATRSADVYSASAVARFVEIALLGFEVVRSAKFLKRRGFGLEVRTAFFGEGRTAHSRHPRQ